MILRDRGLLTTGRIVDDAFYQMSYLEQACRLQVKPSAACRIPPITVS